MQCTWLCGNIPSWWETIVQLTLLFSLQYVYIQYPPCLQLYSLCNSICHFYFFLVCVGQGSSLAIHTNSWETGVHCGGAEELWHCWPAGGTLTYIYVCACSKFVFLIPTAISLLPWNSLLSSNISRPNSLYIRLTCKWLALPLKWKENRTRRQSSFVLSNAR